MFDFSPAPVDNSQVFYNQAANGEFEKNCHQNYQSCQYPHRNPFSQQPVYCQRDGYFTRTGCTNIPSLSMGNILSMRVTDSRN